jgi:hypothetical protein
MDDTKFPDYDADDEYELEDDAGREDDDEPDDEPDDELDDEPDEAD